MKKSDLKTGMTVKVKNRLYKVLENVETENYGIQKLLFAEDGGFMCGDRYNENLSHVDNSSWDITEVYDKLGTTGILEIVADTNKLLWKREEEQPKVEIIDGEVYAVESKNDQKWLFRAEKGSSKTQCYSSLATKDKNFYEGGRVYSDNDELMYLRKADYKGIAELVKYEIKAGYYWNGKELIEL